MSFTRRIWWVPVVIALLVGLLAYWGRRGNSRMPEDSMESQLSPPAPHSPPPKTPPQLASAPARTVPSLESRTHPSEERSDASVQESFRILLHRHKEALSKFRASQVSKFDWESGRLYREARLFALAYSKFAGRAAAAVALDPGADQQDRSFCTYMLAILSSKGDQSALTALRSLVSDSREEIGATALWGISLSDPDGQFKNLYWEKCRNGMSEAFEIISKWVDPGTIAQMNSLLRTPQDQYAKNTLERMQVLASPKWRESVEAILKGQPADLNEPFHWALAVMQEKDPVRLREVLRTQLDIGLQNSRLFFAEYEPDEKFEKEFPIMSNVKSPTKIEYYDEKLVSYWEAGGELNELEKARLRTFGYACDPQLRLEELLATGK